MPPFRPNTRRTARLIAVRLRNWARYSLIILAVLEVPWVVLAALRGGLVVLLPVTIASVLIVIYLLRQPVARIFALGLGPATVPAAEADALERVICGSSRD